MDLKKKKEGIARLYGVGKDRIVFNEEFLEEIKEAITKGDFRALKAQGAFSINPIRGASRGRYRKRLEQKRKGRQQGKGSRKGKQGARATRKEEWMNKIRNQREFLKLLKTKGVLSVQDYRRAYRLAKGGAFRSKRHLKTTLEENNMIKKDGTI